MRLKKLQLQGYKTFANKTEFLFDEGITAVVGPNGSGKSNIADAVRWVLGEQRSSALRGKKTADMIFAGSPTKPRAGMANAILTLDNRDGWLPIDYAEVEIGRKAYRSGENEYFLNGSRVRLRDIRDLLATSGLAQRTYTMIGQGLVDRALSLKADERRALFEEAAGISHYKDRRTQTLRRLQETQRNIERVNDVLAEIEPRLRSLKRQANRAENYETLSNDLSALLKIWYGYQWRVTHEEVLEARERAKSAEKKWKTARRQLIFLQEQIEESRRRLNHYRSQIQQKETEREGLREQFEHARRQVAILTERQTLVTRQLAEIDGELPDLEVQQLNAQRELAHATEALAEVQKQLNLERAELATFEKSFKVQQAEIEARRGAVKKLERELWQTQQFLSQADGQLTQLREQLAAREKETFDAAELDKLAEQANTLKAEMNGIQTAQKQVQAKRKELDGERKGLLRELKQLRRAQGDLARSANGVSKEVAKLEARVETLRHIQARKAKIKGKFERLAALVSADSQHQDALEAALQLRLNTIIFKDADALFKLLTKNPNTPLTAFVTQETRIHERHTMTLPDEAQWLCDVIESSDQAVTDVLLGDFVYVANDGLAYEIALRLPAGLTVIGGNGAVIHAGGIVEQRPSDNLLAQKREIESAEKAVLAKQADFAAAQQAVRDNRTATDEKQRAADKFNGRDRKLQIEGDKFNKQYQKLQRDHDRVQQQQRYLKRQRDSHASDIGRLQKRIAELENARTERDSSLAIIEQKLQAERLVLQEMPVGEAQQQRYQRQQQVSATQTIVDGRRAVTDSRRATLNQVENRLSRQRQRLASLRNQQAEIDLETAQSKLSMLRGRMETLANDLKPLRSIQKKIRGDLSDVEGDLSVHQKTAHQTEEHYTEARLTLNQIENRIDTLRERISSDLGIVALAYDESETVQTPLPIEEVVDELPTVEVLPDGIEQSIRKRRGQMQRMGAINPDAPTEYKETKERYDFLSEQIEDLLATEKQLRDVITELDDLTSREFGATVERVNGIFGEMFTQLFGGGSAELHLTDPDNLTISGVDIIAKLPRRRAQGLALLSGGERSLTAAALIFSLLKVTPPPFCMMDEVDAALDEANINRFRDVLRDLAMKTQFIVITHNRGTVQAANTIYGISMGTDSASQVLSLKPEDYVNSEDFL